MDTAALMTAAAVAYHNDTVACYNLFLHSNGPVVAAGSRLVSATNWKIRVAEWARDAGVGQSESFLSALRSVTCDVFMVPDGTVLRPGSPFARVEGPVAQAAVMASMIAAMCASASTVATAAFRARRPDGTPVVYDGDMPGMAFIGGADATAAAVPVEGMRRIVVEHPDLHCLIMDRGKALNAIVRAFGGDVLLFAHDLESLRMAARMAISLKQAGKKLFGIWVDESLPEETIQEYREILDMPGLTDVPIYARSSDGTFAVAASILRPDGSGLVRSTYQVGAVKHRDYWDSRPWNKGVPAGVLQVRRVVREDSITDFVYDEAMGVVDSETHQAEPVGGGDPVEIAGVGGGEDLMVQILTSAQPTSFPETLAAARERNDAQAVLHVAASTHVLVRDANAAEIERGALRP